MNNNNSNVFNNVGDSSKIEIFNKSDSNNIIPINWKKYGEIYCNKLEQPMFVCSICLDNTNYINALYTTSDASAFWCHIQHQHISVEYETIDKISEEIRNFITNGVETEVSNEENNSKMDESADLNVDNIKENNIQLLEQFHENLIKNNISKETEFNEVSHNIDIGKELQQTVISSDINDVKPNIKVEEMEQQYVNKFANCNYYYDNNETYMISDDDHEDEDDDQEELTENYGILRTPEEPRETNYLKHNDMIEISDDEDGQDDVDTRPHTPTSINNETETHEVINRIETDSSESGQKNLFNIFDRVSPHNIEGNNLPQSNTNAVHSLNGIPTPDISSCESLTNQHFDANSNAHQYNKHSDLYYKDSQSSPLHNLSRKGVYNLRPFQCNICGLRTVNKLNMEEHQQRVHNIPARELTRNEFPHAEVDGIQRPYNHHRWILLQSSDRMSSTNRPFKCKICMARTKTEKNMKRHQILLHSPDSHLFTTECGICNKKVLKTNLKTHLLCHSSSGHKCDYCGVIYKSKQYLNNHIRKLHPERYIYSVPQYPQKLQSRFHIAPGLYMQNNQQHLQESSVVSSKIDTTATNLMSAEEQQLRYRECEQIFKLLESSTNIKSLQNL